MRDHLECQRLAAAAGAGAAGWMVVFPCDVARTRMCAYYYEHIFQQQQRNNAHYTVAKVVAPPKVELNLLKFWAQMFRKEGVRGLYRGCWYTIVRAIPTAMATMPAYDYAYEYMREKI